MNISREELERMKTADPFTGRESRLIADLERARELLQAFVRAYEKATPSGGYDVAEANAYCEAAAYLKDAGIE